MTPDEVIAEIVRILYETGANDWSVQDKAALLTAVNLQLQEEQEEQG